jgi:DNA excision repair protein ERCC-8
MIRSDGKLAIWDIRAAKSCLMFLDYEKTKLKHKRGSTASSAAQSSGSSIAHSGPIIGLTYTQDGNHLISLGKDNTLRLWDSHNGLNTQVNYGRVPLSSAVAETCLQVSCTELCDPNSVFVPSGNNLLMYDIFNGEMKQTFKGHFDSVNCSFYNSMQHEIYTGSKDRNILVWSTEPSVSKTRSSIKSKAGHGSKRIYSVFSSSNRGGQGEGEDAWSEEDS